MSFYNTGNPVPSIDPRDLDDNAKHLDVAIHSPDDTWVDRLGATRKSIKGVENGLQVMEGEFDAAQADKQAVFDASQADKQAEFLATLAAMGYEIPIPYAAGIVFSRPTQTVQYLSEIYKAKPGVLPFTTTGTWATDSLKLTGIGDATLRQDLSQPTGASLSGWARSALLAGITKANQMFDAQAINIWENAFVSLITTKPNPAVPSTWDWLPAIQAFANYLTTNHVQGYMPPGRYKINGKINVKNTYGWGFIGAGNESTIIEQMADNVPIFDLGAIAGDAMHSYAIRDMQLTYTNVQPATNVNANPIYFTGSGFEGEFKHISFMRGSWAIRLAPGQACPWGQSWDQLQFKSGLTGGAIDWTSGVNAVPNNVWGRFFIDAANMVGPIFKQIRGYNWTINAIEILSGTNVQWIDAQAGSQVTITALKMELMNYTGTLAFNGSALINFPSGIVRIDQLNLAGTNAILTTANQLNLVNITTGDCEIGRLTTLLTVASSNFYLANMSAGSCRIHYPVRGSFPVTDYTNVSSAVAADFLVVTPDKNDKLSSNKGDADYTVAFGDPAMVRFETTLTAQRTINLPSGNMCFNGLRYRIMSSGAVNGANTLVVKASTVTKATLSADKTWVELEWRRNATAHNGWLVVGQGTLP